MWVIVVKRERSNGSASQQWFSYSAMVQLLSNGSAISWREQLHFQWDVDEICFVLYQQFL
jgi:hypothetical protein